MATKTEKAITPPLISFSSFVNFLNQLREHEVVPSRIDKTLMPKASGSQTSGMLAALRYLGLIDEAGKPNEMFKAWVMQQDSERKSILADTLKRSYAFLFDDENFHLESASSGEMIEKFRARDISGSTITKAIAFFLAAAKEANVKVSTHIRAPTVVRQTGAPRRVGKAKERDEVLAVPSVNDKKDEEGTERFEIPIPGKSSVKVIVPSDLDGDDWEMLQSMITVYIKRWKGFKTTE